MGEKVFLGGTCNESKWREECIRLLRLHEIEYFDPVVSDWTEAAQIQELHERTTCQFLLYCLTPKMTGVYSVAEVVDDSNKRPDKTILVLLGEDDEKRFDIGAWMSMKALGNLVMSNGGIRFYSLEKAVEFIHAKCLEKIKL